MASYDIVILLLGPTRSGKTTFANKVARPVDGKAGGSNTTTCKDYYKKTDDGKSILLIDTPGLDDSPTGNLAVLNIIADKISKSPKINAVIYFHQICGTAFFAQTAFVTTMWNTLNPKQRDRFDGLHKLLENKMGQSTNNLTKSFKFNSNNPGSGPDVLQHLATSVKIGQDAPKLQLAEDVAKFDATPSGVRRSAAGKQILKEMNKGICVIV